MFNEVLDHLVEVAVTSAQKQCSPLPVPVGAHQMKCETNVHCLLLNELELLPSLGMYDRPSPPGLRPVEQALLKPVQLHAQPRTAGWWVLQRAVKCVGFGSRWIGR